MEGSCVTCGQDKSVCEKCKQNYSDMYMPKSLTQVEKAIEINGELYCLARPTYLNGKIPEDRKLDWTIDMYNPDRVTRFVIAFLHWRPKDMWYDVESCGLRLCEYGNTELLRWIMAKAEELAYIIREEEDC